MLQIITNNYYWSQYWDKHCDSRTVHFWLMSGGPWKLLAITTIYILMIIFSILLMRKRKPFEIRMPMFIYNVCLILINLYFFYKSFWWTNYGKELLKFRFPSVSDQSTRAKNITNLYMYYLLSKFIDYFDTFFFILRKKNNQITPLHVYHHISVPIVGWIYNWVFLLLIKLIRIFKK